MAAKKGGPHSCKEIDHDAEAEFLVLHRIKRHLRLLGVNQEEAAKRLGISAPSLSQIMNGNRAFKLPILIKLIGEFNLDPRILAPTSHDIGGNVTIPPMQAQKMFDELLKVIIKLDTPDGRNIKFLKAYADGMLAAESAKAKSQRKTIKK
jgi:transcriptional regulator with XRE-family HTH domain